MTQQTFPLSAKLALIAGVVLIWIWEFGLAMWGNRGIVSWILVIVGAALILCSFAILLVHEHR